MMRLFFLILFSFSFIYRPAESAAPSAVVYFSPYDRLDEKLIALIDKEETKVLVAVYAFTHRGIADALIRAQKRGVYVDIIVDPFSLRGKAVMSKMRKAKMMLSVWDVSLKTASDSSSDQVKRRSHHSLMHDKFCLFSNGVVWTGSYNFTYDATFSNCENSIVFCDPQLAARYEEIFYRIKKEFTRGVEEYVQLNPLPTHSNKTKPAPAK